MFGYSFAATRTQAIIVLESEDFGFRVHFFSTYMDFIASLASAAFFAKGLGVPGSVAFSAACNAKVLFGAFEGAHNAVHTELDCKGSKNVCVIVLSPCLYVSIHI
jgi:hypothetical protein